MLKFRSETLAGKTKLNFISNQTSCHYYVPNQRFVTKKFVFNNLKKITHYYNNGFEEDIYIYI